MQPGVYEFPLGITISELLGAVGGTNAEAVRLSGTSGRYVLASEFKRKIAFEDIPPGGTIIVFGLQRNMLSVARNLLEFFAAESCGQCTPCREGIPILLNGIKNLVRDANPKVNLTELLALAESVQLSSKCNVGRSAANTFAFVIRQFYNGNKS
jgi:[NiFe] hydrogenase diaphorase moiety large subunit